MYERNSRFDPRLVDAAVVVAVAVPPIIGFAVLVMTEGAAWSEVLGTALALAQAGVLWWRRRHPLAVLAASLVMLIVSRLLVGMSADAFVGLYAAAYAIAAYGSRRSATLGLAGIVTAVAVDLVIINVRAAGATLISAIGVLLVISWGIGRYVRVRRDHLDTLVAYAHQLEIDRDEKARREVLEERRRIARELHDQVAHHLGIAALHTSAARRWLTRDTDRAASAMASTEDAIRSALTTMPVILQALRVDDGAGELTPQPTLDALDQLISDVSETGLAVDLRVDGERRTLDPAVELAAYRLVQEALTNTLKHAQAHQSTVLLHFAEDRLDIEVTDDGVGGTPVPGSGLGLIGMRERVDVVGGAMTAAPREGGGFAVRATLPIGRREDAR